MNIFKLGSRAPRWTPFREINDRWSFFNPNMTNPATGNLGALSYIGNGAGKCNCSSPVNTWYKNFGPRLGFAWQTDPRDVVRGSFSIVITVDVAETLPLPVHGARSGFRL
jgi:hypothetical protein